MTATPVDREFCDLLDAACAGALDEDRAQRLQTMLLADPTKCEQYLRHYQLRTDLYLLEGARRARAASTDVLHAIGAAPQAAPVQTVWQTAVHWMSQPLGLSLFFATLCLISFLLTTAQLPSPVWLSARRPASEAADAVKAAPVIARVTQTLGAHWQNGALPGRTLRAGRSLLLAEGLAEVTLDSGARFVLHGPAELQLESSRRVALQAGRLLAEVPERAYGFSVVCPTMTVVDLGTQFGVEVAADGAAEVFVFKGRVSLEPRDAAEPHVELAAGEAARLAPQQTLVRRAADPRVFAAAQALLRESQATAEAAVAADFDAPLWSPEQLLTAPFDAGNEVLAALHFTYAGAAAGPPVEYKSIRFERVPLDPDRPSEQTGLPLSRNRPGVTLDYHETADAGPRRQRLPDIGFFRAMEVLAYVGVENNTELFLDFQQLGANRRVFLQLLGGDAFWTADLRVIVNGADEHVWTTVADGDETTPSIRGFAARTNDDGSLSLRFEAMAGQPPGNPHFAGLAGVVLIGEAAPEPAKESSEIVK